MINSWVPMVNTTTDQHGPADPREKQPPFFIFTAVGELPGQSLSQRDRVGEALQGSDPRNSLRFGATVHVCGRQTIYLTRKNPGLESGSL